MKVGVITTSRADFGIYRPLLDKLESSNNYDLHLFVLGQHLEQTFGNTIDEIKQCGFRNIHEIKISKRENFDPVDISMRMGETTKNFAQVYTNNQCDLIFCLGDRYEMFAAVSSLISFPVAIAHLHGGEQTLGAIDNKFRHAITQLSDLHFTATKKAYDTVKTMTSSSFVYNTGALSLDKLKDFIAINKSEFYKKYELNEEYKYSLVTVHPETLLSKEQNLDNLKELFSALTESKKHFVIGLPNADTHSNYIREEILKFCKKNSFVTPIENFGKDYFSALTHFEMMIGNSSSGILEAASFSMPVINIGNRQKGREQSNNIINSSFSSNEILEAIKVALSMNKESIHNIYYSDSCSDQIIKVLETEFKDWGNKNGLDKDNDKARSKPHQHYQSH